MIETRLQFVGIMIFAVAVFLWLIALVEWIRHGKTIQWQKTQGIVTRSAIGNRKFSRPHGETHIKYYIHKIEYSYQVDGKEYLNDVIRGNERENSYLDEGKARNAQLNVKTGDAITVYYNPRNPMDTTLEPDYKEQNIFFGLGLLAAIISVFLWFWKY